MTKRDERIRQAEIDAARSREIEEERLAETERVRHFVEERNKLAHQKASASLPNIDAVFVGRPARVIRDYVRSIMVPEAVKRMFDIGMGITKFDTPGAFGAVLQLEAPATAQVKALTELIGIGVPKLRGGFDGDGSPINGVIVLGTLEGLDEARRRAQMHRMEDHGMVGGPSPGLLAAGGGYVPPPGHKVVVIEDDLSGAKKASSPDDAPTSTPKPLTKAQQIAAKRRATKRK